MPAHAALPRGLTRNYTKVMKQIHAILSPSIFVSFSYTYTHTHTLTSAVYITKNVWIPHSFQSCCSVYSHRANAFISLKNLKSMQAFHKTDLGTEASKQNFSSVPKVVSRGSFTYKHLQFQHQKLWQVCHHFMKPFLQLPPLPPKKGYFYITKVLTWHLLPNFIQSSHSSDYFSTLLPTPTPKKDMDVEITWAKYFH